MVSQLLIHWEWNGQDHGSTWEPFNNISSDCPETVYEFLIICRDTFRPQQRDASLVNDERIADHLSGKKQIVSYAKHFSRCDSRMLPILEMAFTMYGCQSSSAPVHQPPSRQVDCTVRGQRPNWKNLQECSTTDSIWTLARLLS